MKLWIARDKDGYSQLYVEKPIKKDGYFECIPNTKWFTISCNLFPEVTFENSPQEVELTLCNHTDTVNIQDCNPKKQTCVLTNHGIVTDVIFK